MRRWLPSGEGHWGCGSGSACGIAPGQGTPIHDHGGLWCVECVLQGRIEVRAYRPTDAEGDRADVDFQRQRLGPLGGPLQTPDEQAAALGPADRVRAALVRRRAATHGRADPAFERRDGGFLGIGRVVQRRLAVVGADEQRVAGAER